MVGSHLPPEQQARRAPALHTPCVYLELLQQIDCQVLQLGPLQLGDGGRHRHGCRPGCAASGAGPERAPCQPLLRRRRVAASGSLCDAGAAGGALLVLSCRSSRWQGRAELRQGPGDDSKPLAAPCLCKQHRRQAAMVADPRRDQTGCGARGCCKGGLWQAVLRLLPRVLFVCRISLAIRHLALLPSARCIGPPASRPAANQPHKPSFCGALGRL